MPSRLPAKEDMLLVFGGIAFFVHIWALYNMLKILPSWVQRLSPYDLAAVISYVLVFALLESLVIWFVLILMAVVLPRRLLRDHFVSQAMALCLITFIWSVAAHNNYVTLVQNRELLPFWFAGYLVTLLAVYFFVSWQTKIDLVLQQILQKIIVLSLIYVFFDLLGLLVIISRQIIR